MPPPSHRRLAAGVTATPLTLVLGAAPASAHPRHRHRHRHHGLVLTAEQRACLGEHGFGRDQPWQDFRDPAVRARLVQALRECGVIKSAPPEPTTTTTSKTAATSPIFES